MLNGVQVGVPKTMEGEKLEKPDFERHTKRGNFIMVLKNVAQCRRKERNYKLSSAFPSSTTFSWRLLTNISKDAEK